MSKDHQKEFPEFNFVYDALENIYLESDSEGYEIRDIAQLLFQLVSVKIYEVADSKEQALGVITFLSHATAERLGMSDINVEQLTYNPDNQSIN